MLNAQEVTARLRRDMQIARMKVEIANTHKALDQLERAWELGGVDMDEDYQPYRRFLNAAYAVCEIDELYKEPDEDTYDGRVLDREARAHKAAVNAAEVAVIAAYRAQYGDSFIDMALPNHSKREAA